MATEAVSKLATPSLQVQGGKLDIGWPKDPVAFLAWVNAEQVVARLHEQIDRLPAPANALSAAEQTAARLRSTPASSTLSMRKKRWSRPPLRRANARA
jgi:hypothetical protein